MCKMESDQSKKDETSPTHLFRQIISPEPVDGAPSLRGALAELAPFLFAIEKPINVPRDNQTIWS